jgi:hypothetical protein
LSVGVHYRSDVGDGDQIWAKRPRRIEGRVVGWVVRSWAKRPLRGTGCGGDAVVAVVLTLQ